MKTLPKLNWLSQLLIGVLALAGLLAGAYFLGADKKKTGIGLVVDAKHLDFGVEWETSQFTWSLPIENKSSGTINIDAFSTTCTCARIEPDRLTVEPGTTKEVKLILNLTYKDPRQPDTETRAFSATLAPKLQGGVLHDLSWTVRGKVKRAYKLDPPFLDFGKLDREERWAAKGLSVDLIHPHSTTEVRCSSNSLTARLLKTEDQHKLKVDVAVADTMPTGFFSHKVEVVLKDEKGRQLLIVQVPVIGMVRDVIMVHPNRLHLGGIRLGERAEGEVGITMKLDPGVHIVDMQCPSGVTASPNQQQGNSIAVKVSALASKLGHHEVVMKMTFKELATERTRVVSVPVTYHGFRQSP